MSEHPYSLAGRRVLVCGATGDIGGACAALAGRMGASLVLAGRREAVLETRAAALRAAGVMVETVVVDFHDGRAMEAVAAALPELDGWVNAAGMALVRPVRLTAPEDWGQVLAANVSGPAELCRQVLRRRRLRPGSSMVWVGSVAGRLGASGYTAYSASKAAVGGLVRSLAVELAPLRIRVNAVSPGLVGSGMADGLGQVVSVEERARYEAGYPLGLGTVEDVAGAVVFLLSPASRWVTGQDWAVDGGISVK